MFYFTMFILYFVARANVTVLLSFHRTNSMILPLPLSRIIFELLRKPYFCKVIDNNLISIGILCF